MTKNITTSTPNAMIERCQVHKARDIAERRQKEIRHSLACTNIIENMNGTIMRACGNIKQWRNAGMALRRTAASMSEPPPADHEMIKRMAREGHPTRHPTSPSLP